MPRPVASNLPPESSSSMSHIPPARQSHSTANNPNPKTPAAQPSRRQVSQGESSRQPQLTTENIERPESPRSLESSTNQEATDPADEWYEVRDIIDERKVGRNIQYLIDWEDNKRTGQVYPPTWTPARDVNEEAIGFWEEIKRARKIKANKEKNAAAAAKTAKADRKKDSQSSYSTSSQEDSRPLTPPEASEASADDAPEDPVRSKSRKRTRSRRVIDDSDTSDASDASDSSDGDIPNKRPRRTVSLQTKNQTHQSYQSQSLSQNSLSLLSSPPNTRPPSVDSDEGSDAVQLQNEARRSQDEHNVSVAAIVDSVEIEPGAEFDPNEYTRLSQFASQPQSQVSARVIPDSQPDSALFPTASDENQPRAPHFDDEDDNALEGLQGPETQPSPAPALPAQEQVAAPEKESQRESQTGKSATASGSRVNFQTQPDPDFSLLSLQSQNPRQTPFAARTPVSTGPSNISYSVVPDSTRPARNSTGINSSQNLLSSAQIVPALHSSEDPLGRSLPLTTQDSASQTSRMDGDKPRQSLSQALRDTIGDTLEFGDASLPDPSQGFPSLMTQEDTTLASAAALAAASSAPLLTTASPAMLMAPSMTMSMAPNDPIVPLMGDPVTTMPGAMFNTPLVIGGVPTGTIAPSDMSFSNPMVSGALEVSPEPEDHSSPQPMQQDNDGNDDNVDNENEDENNDDNDDSDDELDMSNPNYTTHEYVVTLPMASNTRKHYIDMLDEKDVQETIKKYSSYFSTDIAQVPEADTVARVDDLLRKFIDICDLPTFHDSTPGLSEEERMKKAVNTNTKYSFVYEFLERISTLKKTVLILAGRNAVLDYIEAVVNTAGISSERISAANSAPAQKKTHFGTLSVLLGNASELTADNLPSTGIDIVIGFDHVARTSGLLGHYVELSTAGAPADKASLSGGLPTPIILFLVSAFTIEHVDVRLELMSVDDLERKNALLLSVLQAIPYLRDYIDSHLPMAPHDAAKAFGQMITSPSIELEWQPQPLPEDVFDIYMESLGPSQPTFTQEENIGLSQPLQSRKRQLDDNADNNAEAKRARLGALVEDQPAVSETVKKALGGALLGPGTNSGPMVQISLAQLEALAAQVTSLQDLLQEKESLELVLTGRVDTLDKLNKSCAKTIRTCQERLLEATKDRGVFQSERDKATATLATTQERLATRTEALAEMRTQKADLETQLADANKLLAGSAQPDIAEMGTLRTDLAAAKDRVAALERKLANTDEDLDHARHAYQDASNAAADLSTENRDLSARVKDLEHRASDNLRQIHEAHARNEAAAYRAQWSEAVTMLKERQSELDWTREELRVLKNGRRETRQQSVPRSPRLGVMSPRTVGGRVGNGNGNGNGHGNGVQSASRGNSPVSASFDPSAYSSPLAADSNNASGGPPVPGMTYFAPSHRSGRMGHLRE